MWKNRKFYTAKFKWQVVMELISWKKTQAEITSEYWVHPSQQNAWKATMVNNMEQLFKDKRVGDDKKKDKKIDNLFRQIGQLTYELDWVKKKTGVELWWES